MSREVAGFLRACVIAKVNLVISGGTGTGKTTFLNALSAFIPRQERVVTIEDPIEIRLRQPHVVTLEARPGGRRGQESRSRSATSSATRCACAPIASSSARSAAPRRST